MEKTMKSQKLSLNKLQVKSFTTADPETVKGGTGYKTLGPLACTAFCGPGVTCPECAYTVAQPECGETLLC